MLYVFAASAIVIVLMLTFYFIYRYNNGIFWGRGSRGIYQYSDQQLLCALDNIVVKYHSLDLGKLDKTLEQKGQVMSDLYWCDLTRLYAFSTENEVFKSFLGSLTDEFWQSIIGSYDAFRLQQIKTVAKDIYNSRERITLEQSEHFRYSIRNANERMQEELCFHIRHYYCSDKITQV